MTITGTRCMRASIGSQFRALYRPVAQARGWGTYTHRVRVAGRSLLSAADSPQRGLTGRAIVRLQAARECRRSRTDWNVNRDVSQ